MPLSLRLTFSSGLDFFLFPMLRSLPLKDIPDSVHIHLEQVFLLKCRSFSVFNANGYKFKTYNEAELAHVF